MGQLIHSPTWSVPTLLSFILTYGVNLDGMYFYVTKGEIRGMEKCATFRMLLHETKTLSCSMEQES